MWRARLSFRHRVRPTRRCSESRWVSGLPSALPTPGWLADCGNRRLPYEGQRREGLIVKISVVGCGYVGLVTGACLADSGNDVICVDIDQAKIDLLLTGGIPI